MAKAKLARRTHTPGVPRKRYELAVRAASAARRKSSEVGKERLGVLIGAGTAFLVGHYEKDGKKLPTLAGVEPTALCGAVLAFGPSLFGIRGKFANMAAESGASMLGLAAYKAGLGQPIIAGEDED